MDINNSKDITCDSLYLLHNNVISNILNVIGIVSAQLNSATYTTTTLLNILLAAKQNTLIAGSGILISGNTISSSVADQLTCTLPMQKNGTVLSSLWSPTNVTVETGLLALKSDTLGTLILSLTGTESRTASRIRDSNSVVRELTASTNGGLLWNNNELQLVANSFTQINAVLPLTVTGANNVTLDSLWKPSSMAVGTGITATPNDSLGTLAISLNGTESRIALKLKDTNNVVRDLKSNTAGDLIYNEVNFNNLISAYQPQLINYTELEGLYTTIIATAEDHPILPLYLSWVYGYYGNVANSHQILTVPYLWHPFPGVGTGTCYMSVDLKAGTTNEIVFSINEAASWSQMKEIKFSSIPADSWTTYNWEFTLPSNGTMNFHAGVIPPGSVLSQTTGTVLFKNFKLYKNTATSNIWSKLLISEDTICKRTLTATSYVSNSDRNIKKNIADADVGACLKVFNSVNVKTYERIDLPGKRLGFIAQDIQSSVPTEFGNLVHTQYGGQMPLLSLDYSRMVCILWNVCKDLQSQLAK